MIESTLVVGRGSDAFSNARYLTDHTAGSRALDVAGLLGCNDALDMSGIRLCYR